MVKSAVAMSASQLANAYQHACLAEIEAMKPGNVHIFADGHGMVVNDFILSAEASAPWIAQPEFSLGERIYYAVDATWKAVGCNTNLGIILLCAPIIHAVLHSRQASLQAQLAEVLSNTTQQDAQWAFKAIRLARPAGLGASEQHDVNHDANCTLLEAMQAAASKDSIAQQYSQHFQDVFTLGLTHYQAQLARWQRPAWATTATYLQWLATFQDSHVLRKHGIETAAYLQREAAAHALAFNALDNPKLYLPQLMQFDQQLKAQQINPGTSADLTVATLLIHHIATIVNN
jgi:triphosphoribosyl-dephospho-CoA synthase